MKDIVQLTRAAVADLINHEISLDTAPLQTRSAFISEKVGIDYDRLSRVFSQESGKTVERYIMEMRIEKVKELVLDGKYTLGEIARMLKYSSQQYMSNQFRKVTGITITEFRKLETHW